MRKLELAASMVLLAALCGAVELRSQERKDWAASWIWAGGEANPKNLFLMARKSIELAAKPDSATLRVTSASRYKLFVNGHYVGRGPARSDPRWKSFDSHDVAALLAPGRNTIAVLAYHLGPGLYQGYRGSSYTTGERAGLWALLELGTGAARQVVGTGPDWAVREAEGWQREIPPINPLQGFPELYDASKDPVDWAETSFDDSGWQKAAVVPESERPWVRLEPRDVPFMREKEVFPKRVVDAGEVIELPVGGYDIGDRVYDLLMKEIHLPLEHARIEDRDAVLARDGRAARLQARYVRGDGIRDPYLLVDFGRQVFGFPRVHMTAPGGAVVDMTYGQQLLGGRVPPGLPYGDRYIAREGRQVWETFGYRQFRYLQVDFRSRKPVEVDAISLNAYQYPAEERGRFECSDPLLTKLWRACVDTAYLQMEDVIAVDGQRERVNYAGIDIPQAIYAAYGDTEVVRRCFRMISREDKGGLLPGYYPPDALVPVFPRLILLWLTQVEEHYRYVGDRRFLAELYPAVKRQMDWFATLANQEGVIGAWPYFNYWDWSWNDLRGTDLLTNAAHVHALEACARIADALDDRESATRWRARAQKVRERLRPVYWNEPRGLFEDTFYKGRLTGIASELGNGFALLAGLPSPEQRVRLLQHFKSEPPTAIAEVSPIYLRQVLWALVEAGRLETAVGMMRERYRQMIEMFDNPTIWEGWRRFSGEDPITTDEEFEQVARGEHVRAHARRSLVHGGVAPALVLSREVLGIKGVGPGFQECRIEVPALESVEWARGVFPSVRGDISAEWRRERQSVTLAVEIPAGLSATLSLPGGASDLRLDGKPATGAARVTGGKHQLEGKLARR
jgi:hypothetical protein